MRDCVKCINSRGWQIGGTAGTEGTGYQKVILIKIFTKPFHRVSVKTLDMHSQHIIWRWQVKSPDFRYIYTRLTHLLSIAVALI